MIILLNGASSAGKTSITKELQTMFDDVFLNMGIDKFMSPVPANHHETERQLWHWEKEFDSQSEVAKLTIGPRGKSYIEGMYDCVNIMAHRGFNIIIDDVCLDAALLKQAAGKLQQFTVYFIGVTCELSTLEKRELTRGNRVIHSARGQYNVVHRPYYYDLTVDTTTTCPRECALHIKAFIEKNQNPIAFNQFFIEKTINV